MPRMLDVGVYVEAGDVLVRQKHLNLEQQIITLRPEQIPLVIQWLQAAAEEAKTKQAGGA